MRQHPDNLVGEHLLSEETEYMKKIIFAAMTFIIAVFFMACGGPAANNAPANKPANAANAANTATAPAVDKAAVEGELKKTIDEFVAALNKGEADGLTKFYTDDYEIVDQTGQVSTKAARLEAIKSGKIKMEGLKVDDLKFKINPTGTAAVVVGHITGKNLVDGKSEDRNSMVTWVIVKNDKGWQFTNAQVTDIKAGAATAAKPDDAKKADDKKTGGAPPPAPANK
jgi:ketosteroid isomerase-like protein